MPYEEIIVPELLPPSEDGIFKTLLTHTEAKPILRDVVESYLRFPIVNVEVRNVELPISDINEKRERFDVNCTIDDGSQCDVEMQSEAMKGDSLRSDHKIVKCRSIYHLCDLHSSQEGRSVRYDKLLKSFQMTFCGFDVFQGHDRFVRRFRFRDEDGIEFSDAVGIIFVELTKLSDVLVKPVEKMTGEELWALFFAYASNPKHKDLLSKIMAVKEEIAMAVELLQKISKDEIERARYRSRRMFEMDYQHNLIAAVDERIAIIINNAFRMKMSINDIMALTGLSCEEIENYRKAE
jgi:predicted transposase/invertase (TIGR01784 family)